MTQNDPSNDVMLLRQIRDLLVVLVQHSPAAGSRALTAKDRKALATLLPAISRAIGDAVFTVADLQGHAAIDVELRNALGSIGRRCLGKLFARCTGLWLDGVRVERVGTVRDGALWRVTR